jgi:hypothetical protein
MATPGKLVHTVAAVLGIPEATVVQHDRNLAEAELRTKGGRGRSAARVTSHDAANLLIAICGAPISGASVKESLTTCNRYGPLRAYDTHGSLGSFSKMKVQFPTLAKLPVGHRFKDAIAALIDSLVAGEFDVGGRRTGVVSIFFRGPIPSGSISVEARRQARLWYRETANPSYSERDLSQERMFTIETLSEIARIIGPRGDENAIDTAVPGKPLPEPARKAS